MQATIGGRRRDKLPFIFARPSATFATSMPSVASQALLPGTPQTSHRFTPIHEKSLPPTRRRELTDDHACLTLLYILTPTPPVLVTHETIETTPHAWWIYQKPGVFTRFAPSRASTPPPHARHGFAHRLAFLGRSKLSRLRSAHARSPRPRAGRTNNYVRAAVPHQPPSAPHEN